jgi:hypothetical protein
MKTINCQLLVILCLNLVICLQAQPGPSIGLNNQPLSSDIICPEPVFTGSFYTSGYAVGSTVADFKLYGISGDSLVLSQALGSGKPVLLVSGSLTCPIFRNKLSVLNQVVSAYAGLLDVYVIYTLEAHPTDTSVYFGYINITSQNQTDGILFASPNTYGERKALADTLVQNYSLSAPLFLDGPCNPWWRNFGPAPNNAYVIRPNGTVAIQHGWFDRSPRNIFCELDTFLGVTSGLCTTGSSGGSFTLTIINQIATGIAGNTLYAYMDLINNSSQDCEIDIVKLQKQLPSGWETSFCADICYGTQDDSIRIVLPAGDTMHFSLDYFTTQIPDTGNVRLGFRNVQQPNNQYAFWTKGDTRTPVSAAGEGELNEEIRIYPNPFSHCFNLQKAGGLNYSIWTVNGQLISSGLISDSGDVCLDVPNGVYIIEVENNRQRLIRLD